jgi:hypothetical protein
VRTNLGALKALLEAKDGRQPSLPSCREAPAPQ